MDRVIIRTCSANQAAVLAAAAGRLSRVGQSNIRIYRPDGREPIDPRSATRYLAKIEVLEPNLVASEPAADAAADIVVGKLFGPYLN